MNNAIKRPNFFIVGAPKCGSTSLYEYLYNHPDVFLPHVKELNFFSNDEIVGQDLYYKDQELVTSSKDYLSHFETIEDEVCIGDTSVSYLFYESVPDKILRFNPKSKIVILLRNPLERAYSHYLMDFHSGHIKCSFGDVVNQVGNAKMDSLAYQQVVELGLYYDQVKRYVDCFGQEMVHIMKFDDIKNDLDKTLNGLVKFLEVDPEKLSYTTSTHNPFRVPRNKFIRILYQNSFIRRLIRKYTPKSIKSKFKNLLMKRANKNKIEYERISDLCDLYNDDLTKLEKLTNINFDEWKSYS